LNIRPSGEHRLTLLDDIGWRTAGRLKEEGFEPAVIVETSPGNLGFGEQWNRKYGYGVVVQTRPGSQCQLSTLSRRPRPTAIRWSNRMTAPSGSHRV